MNHLKIDSHPFTDYHNAPPHFHPAYEIYYFICGDADYYVEGTKYSLTPHSMILLAPNILHRIRIHSDAEYIRYCLYFFPESLSPERRSFLLASFPDYKSKKNQQVVYYENLKEYGFEHLFNCLQKSENLPEKIHSDYFQIYLEAFLAHVRLMCQERHSSPAHTAGTPSTTNAIIQYLNEHIEEPHTLDSLSERFRISKYYLNRCFKKNTGTTVIDFLIRKRIILARQYLTSGMSAGNAAEKVGFSDYSAFYRAYKKIMGTSPRSGKE